MCESVETEQDQHNYPGSQAQMAGHKGVWKQTYFKLGANLGQAGKLVVKHTGAFGSTQRRVQPLLGATKGAKNSSCIEQVQYIASTGTLQAYMCVWQSVHTSKPGKQSLR